MKSKSIDQSAPRTNISASNSRPIDAALNQLAQAIIIANGAQTYTLSDIKKKKCVPNNYCIYVIHLTPSEKRIPSLDEEYEVKMSDNSSDRSWLQSVSRIPKH